MTHNSIHINGGVYFCKQLVLCTVLCQGRVIRQAVVDAVMNLYI